MIELKKINKTYVSKSKRKNHVLKDISLNFPEKGLCVIEGTSGAGKTTLLNILGGLDKNFKGEYFFLGKKLQSAKDFADFRRDHVSFVFQDFNLIKDLTIAENISMGLKFSKTEKKDKISDALSKVGLSGYEDKYPSECSGGEQQRIAIARTMLKDSSMLIADEPTGNLDENTGRGIFDLLKEIAKEKLVIVVTHDESLGSEYADYLVYLKDGLVEHNLPETVTERKYEEKKIKPITNKTALRMAWHEFTRKKIIAIIGTLLIVLCFIVLSVSFSLSRYDLADIQYRLIVDQGYEYICYPFIKGSTIKEYEAQGVELIHSKFNTNNLYFTSKQQAEENGIKFYEFEKTMELGAGIYYLSDFCAQKLISDQEVIVVDGEEIKLDPKKHTIEDLIGASCPLLARGYEIIKPSVYIPAINGVCGGIYYSYFDYETADDIISRYHTALTMGYISLPQYAFKMGYDDFEITVNTKPIALINITSTEKDDDMDYVACFILKENNQIEWFDNIYDGKFLGDLKENEVYVSVDTYNKLFEKKYSNKDFAELELQDDEFSIVPVAKFYPEEIGTSIDVNITNTVTNDEVQFDKLKIKGVIGFVNRIDRITNYLTGKKELFYKQAWSNIVPTLYVTDMNIYEQIYNMPKPSDNCVWVKVDTVKDLRTFVRDHYKSSHSLGDITQFPAVRFEHRYQDTLKEVKKIIEYMAIIFMIVTVVSLIITISMQVKDRTHELAVFKSLGAQNRDLSKIYLFEMLILWVLTLPISVLGAWGATNLTNQFIVKEIDSRLTLWVYELINIPIILGIGAGCILVALIVPLLRICKLNVIDAIKIK